MPETPGQRSERLNAMAVSHRAAIMRTPVQNGEQAGAEYVVAAIARLCAQIEMFSQDLGVALQQASRQR